MMKSLTVKEVKVEDGKFARIRRAVYAAPFMLAAAVSAADVSGLDSLKTNLQTVNTKVGEISPLIIGLVLLGVVLSIVIAWSKKGKRAS